MRCSRCNAELAANAAYCSRCGTPLGASPIEADAAAEGAGRRRWPWIAAAALLLAALAGIAGWQLLGRSGKVGGAPAVQAAGGAVAGGLAQRSERVAPPPLTTDRSRTAPGPADPTPIIDYLSFLKDVERRRLVLTKNHTSETLKQSASITAGNLSAEMMGREEDIQAAHRATYDSFQQALARMNTEWQQLSQYFLSKQPPQACVALRDKYYEVLKTTTAAILQVSTAMSQAMAGNPSAALDQLHQMKGSGMGSASHAVTTACVEADTELANVCDQFRLKKDFDIRDETGSSSLLR